MNKLFFLQISFFAICFFNNLNLAAQNYKYGIAHRLTANDFVSPSSDTTIQLSNLPRGMEITFMRTLSNHWTVSVPIRTGFGKAIYDTVGRVFFGTDVQLIYEFPKYQLIPYFATGLSVQNLSQKWNYGLPIMGGLNWKLEEGFFLNVQTGYRHAFAYKSSNWQHGVGILFKFGKTKSNKAVPKSIIADNTKPVTVEDLNSVPTTEVFRADDVEAQNQLVIPEKNPYDVPKKGTDSLKINELPILKNSITPNNAVVDSFKDSISKRIESLKNTFTKQSLVDTFTRKQQDLQAQSKPNLAFSTIPKQAIDLNKNLIINSLESNGIKTPILLGSLYFDFDQTNLKQSALDSLNQLLKILNQQPFEQLWLRGHTDAFGSNDYNQKLGLQRSEKCQSYLQAHGIRLDKLKIESFGEALPIGNNKTWKGRTQNRRVEFWLIP
jgi:outer membrane protein OmpA-like peptidoglycan-associated protein